MFVEPFTDVVPSFFGMLNQGPLTLTIFLHTGDHLTDVLDLCQRKKEA